MKRRNDVVVKCNSPCVFRERAENGNSYCTRENISLKEGKCTSFKRDLLVDERDEEAGRLYPLFTFSGIKV